MAAYDFKAIRLFVPGPLPAGATLPLDRDQTNYLLNVMRLDEGARIAVFDGHSGEWAARLIRSTLMRAAWVWRVITGTSRVTPISTAFCTM